MQHSKTLKSTEPDNGGEVYSEPEREGSSIRDDDFLFPKLPGGFQRHVIRKKPLEWLKDRYVQVMMASMANHSMALFYCCWSQEQFEAILDEEFSARISRVKNELADRATFIMLRGIGLVDGGDGSRIPPTVTSVMAKVVDGLRDKVEREGPKRGFRLVVDGLDRSATAPASERPTTLPTSVAKDEF